MSSAEKHNPEVKLMIENANISPLFRKKAHIKIMMAMMMAYIQICTSP